MNARLSLLATRLFVALPVFSLALGAIAWLRYGIDIPWFDDWRGYADGSIRSLSLAHIFRPMNDTMAPIGFTLDALAQRYLDGNSVAYQFLSMTVVLGSLLFLQWKLLKATLGNTLHAAVCFLFTLLMLQPDSYWGRENLAYHQCLPLVFILAGLWLILGTDQRRWWHAPALFALGGLAGFTYISGAFGVFAAGGTLLIVARICFSGEEKRDLIRHAGWFALAGVLASGIQFYFSILPSSKGTHAGIQMTLPHEAQFWAFFLGKVGRSLLLPVQMPWVALVSSLAACLTAVAVAVLVVRRARRPDSTGADRRTAALYISISALVLVYLLMVAAGRTRFRPQEMTDLLEIFGHAFTRFHFFWATLLWPWVVACLFVLAKNTAWFRRGQWASFVPTVGAAAIAALMMTDGGAFSHMHVHRDAEQGRAAVARCLMESLQQEGPINCMGLIPPRFTVSAPDAYGAYAYAWNTGASFVRYFTVLPNARRAERLPAFYQMSRVPGKIQIEEIDYLGDTSVRVTGSDPKVVIDMQQEEIAHGCAWLGVELDMRTGVDDSVQVYFMPVGAQGYDESRSRSVAIKSSEDFRTLRFDMKSADGFEPTLRIDPATHPQYMEISDVRVYCRQRLPYGQRPAAP